MITPAYAPTATERVLPRLALDFTTAALDPRVTVTRALNTATVTNSSGVVEIVNANLPRFDYASGVCRGLFIEESRTNVILTSTFATLAGTAGSQYPSGTGWSSFFSTGGTRTYVASSVFSGAQALDIVGVSAARNVIGFNFAAASSTTYTVSFYIEAVSGVSGVIAVATGALGTGGTSTNIAAPTTTGRYSYTFTTGTSAGSVALRFGIGASTNENGSIRISNVQCEVGAFATSYIPTTATTLTRNADVVSMTGTNFSDWYNATGGAILARSRQSVITGTRPSIYMSDGTADNIISLRGLAANPELYIKATTDQAQIDAGTLTANSTFGLVGAWATNNCAAAINGGAAVTDISATIPTVDRMLIGSDGTNYLNGQVERISYWPQRLINAEVQAFSK
jgi:hypothetical protein